MISYKLGSRLFEKFRTLKKLKQPGFIAGSPGTILRQPKIIAGTPAVLLQHPGPVAGFPAVLVGHCRGVPGFPGIVLRHCSTIFGSPTVHPPHCKCIFGVPTLAVQQSAAESSVNSINMDFLPGIDIPGYLLIDPSLRDSNRVV